MYRSLGHLQRERQQSYIIAIYANSMQARLPLPLHLTLAQDPSSLPSRQQRLGIPEVRPINHCFRHFDRLRRPTLASPYSHAFQRRLPATQPPAAHQNIPQKEQHCGWREEHKRSHVDAFGWPSHDQRDSIATWRILIAPTLMKRQKMPYL